MVLDRYSDEHRDSTEIVAYLADSFVDNPVNAWTKYKGAVARLEKADKQRAQSAKELETANRQISQLKKEAATLSRQVASLHEEITKLQAELYEARRVRNALKLVASKTLRMLRHLPQSLLRRLHKSPQNSTRHDSMADLSLIPLESPPSPNSLDVITSPIPAPPENLPQSTKDVPVGQRTLERLIEDLEQYQDGERLSYVLTRLYFTYGDIRRAAAYAKQYKDLVDNGSPKLTTIANQVLSYDAILNDGLSIPPRANGACYLPEPQRVMYCVNQTPGFSSNGYAMRTKGVAKGLLANGWDVTVVARPGYPWDSRYTGARERTERTIDGITYVYHPVSSGGAQSVHQEIDEATDAYIREARRLRPSIIQAASDYRTALPALRAARLLGIPFLYEVRGLWHVTRASTDPEFEDSDRYEFQSMMEFLVAKEADIVLAITSQVGDYLTGHGVDPSRIRIAPNAVDTDDFLPLPRDPVFASKYSPDPTIPVIGYTGSLVDYEGIDILLQSARLIADRGVKFQLLIAGAGVALARLKALSAELQQNTYVHFIGHVNPEDISRLVSIIDIMPLPRLSLPVTELVSPLKPLEAFSAAKAVVLSDIAPHRDLAGSDQQRALLCAPNDVESLADTLLRFITDSELRIALGREARLWCLDERQWRIIAKTIVGAYTDAAAIYRSVIPNTRQLASIRLGLVADEFTTKSFEGSANVIPLDRNGWRNQIYQLDAVLIESAWEGNGGQWHHGVGDYSEEEHADIIALIDACHTNHVPTIFWNKEDPVHTARFLSTAALCDAIFTVDANLIPTYRDAAGFAAKAVASMPFFAQPRIHNIVASEGVDDPTVAYAGTYYGKRYPSRSAMIDRLFGSVSSNDLSIYDRQQNLPDSPYHFPVKYESSIRGGLPYDQVLTTYSAHLAHFNVNSVTTSPTMFSRRVVEIAASGGIVISGPGRGITETFGDAIPVWDPNEIQAVLVSWRKNILTRRHEQWRQTRVVWRSFLADDALAIMLRSVGCVVSPTTWPCYAIVAPQLDTSIAQSIADQSVRPAVVYTNAPFSAVSPLANTGIELHQIEDIPTPNRRFEWMATIDKVIPRTWFEDLLIGARAPGEWQQVIPDPSSESYPIAHAAQTTVYAESCQGLVRGGLWEGIIVQSSKPRDSLLVAPDPGIIHKSPSRAEATIMVKPSRNLLVVGHDLKFLEPGFAYFENAGFSTSVDLWTGHNQHDAERSEALLADADIVFCEWGLGNAAWYSQRIKAKQGFIVRVHAQELSLPYLKTIKFGKQSKMVFVGELIRQTAIRSFSIPSGHSLVIPNMVLTNDLRRPKRGNATHRLGFAGIVPQSKRLDRALDLLEAVLKHDPTYQLSIAGKMPWQYSWMANRNDEMTFYYKQLARVDDINKAHPGAVSFEGHIDDMAGWYASVGHVLSVSDHESFHLTIADGAASSASPHILWWPGSDLIYPRDWIWANEKDIVQAILDEKPSGTSAHSVALANWDIDLVMQQLIDVINESWVLAQ